MPSFDRTTPVNLVAVVTDAGMVGCPVNLVAVVTDAGMVGCGAFDVDALEKFGYPAARVKPAGSASSIETVEDLLRGEIKGANRSACERGVAVGMTGREALDRL